MNWTAATEHELYTISYDDTVPEGLREMADWELDRRKLPRRTPKYNRIWDPNPYPIKPRRMTRINQKVVESGRRW